MKTDLQTSRLNLTDLNIDHSEFILELVNSPEWLKFIGERNIKNDDEAKAYIQKILANPNVQYWVISVKYSNLTVGVITLIKRDYLEHHDLGFALLPQFSKKGIAFEAADSVVESLKLNPDHQKIVAVTIPDNTNSVQLLEKLGFRFEKKIMQNNEYLSIYGLNVK